MVGGEVRGQGDGAVLAEVTGKHVPSAAAVSLCVTHLAQGINRRPFLFTFKLRSHGWVFKKQANAALQCQQADRKKLCVTIRQNR